MFDSKPFKYADKFLEWYCSDELIDEIQGDLYEAYYHRCKRMSRTKASWWFVLDVFRFFKPSSIKRYQRNPNTIDMHKNYLRSAYRNFMHNKAYSFINLFGLIVGIVSCLFISLHVMKEMSYDSFHPESENLYRVVMDMYSNNELSVKSAPVYPAIGPNFLEELPEVEDYMRILPFGNGVYSVKQQNGGLVRYNENNAVYADPNFFSLLGFKLIAGNADKVLADKNQVVLSESTAKKYFGDEDPIGKAIIYRGETEGVVTGVMEDFAENSHMQFDIVSSLVSWEGYEEWNQVWGWYDFYTFIRLENNTDIDQFSQKISNYLDDKKAETYEKYGSREILWLQNIQDIHLHSKGLGWDMGENGNANQVYFLTAIALLILIIAWVNFINLTTARAVKRAKEVGIRKMVGAAKTNLMGQFLTEAFIYNFLAIVISLLIVIVFTPLVNAWLDAQLDSMLMLQAEIIYGLVFLLLVGTVISGFYPAVLLTSFKPLNVLKGNFYRRKKKFGFRQLLVVFQFSISIILILGTILVIRQLKFMQSQDLGLNVDQTLVLQGPLASRGDDDLSNRQNVFASKIVKLASVNGFTKSNIVPGIENFSIGGFYTRQTQNEQRNLYRVDVDENYFPDFEIKILEGRNFNKDIASDINSFILNAEATKLLGFASPKEAIGELINPGGEHEFRVIGVVSDYHHSSLKKSLDPIIFSRHSYPADYF
ncbi:MAG: ABC transporter permease, partial [Bacteroidota bacterium]